MRNGINKGSYWQLEKKQEISKNKYCVLFFTYLLLQDDYGEL